MMLFATVIMALPVKAFACTGIYVGSSLTDDGSFYIGRSEDYGKRYRKVFGVEQATENSGKTYSNAAEGRGFSRPYPEKTYRYTYVRDSANYWGGDTTAYAEAGANELGVSMSATVTTDYNAGAKAADPLLDSGLAEYNLGSIILGESTSARQGCENIGKIVDEYGAGECFHTFIADTDGAWMFASLSGHQWIAFKLDSSVVSVDPNMGSLQYKVDLNDSENVLHSSDIKSLPEEKGFARYFDDGSLNVAATYGPADDGAGQYTRLMIGTQYFNKGYAKSLEATLADDGEVTMIKDPQYTFKPERSNYALNDVLRSLAARGEGGEFDANANSALYPVGNEYQAECHFFQVRSGLPADIATVEWLALSRAEFSIYLPSYASLLTEAADTYADGDVGHDDGDPMDASADGSLVYVFDDLNDLCEDNRQLYGANVRAYFDALQAEIIDQQAAVDAAIQKVPAGERTELANKLSREVTQQVQQKAVTCLKELRAFIKGKSEGKSADDVAGTAFVPSDFKDGKVQQPIAYASVAVAPTISTQPVSATYTKGDAAAPLTVVAADADGSISGLSYQWYVRDSSGDRAVEGATSASFTPATDAAGSVSYFVRVTGAKGLTVDSEVATVQVADKTTADSRQPDQKTDRGDDSNKAAATVARGTLPKTGDTSMLAPLCAGVAGVALCAFGAVTVAMRRRWKK